MFFSMSRQLYALMLPNFERVHDCFCTSGNGYTGTRGRCVIWLGIVMYCVRVCVLVESVSVFVCASAYMSVSVCRFV